MKWTVNILFILAMLTGIVRTFSQQYDRHWLGWKYPEYNVEFMRFDQDSLHFLSSGIMSKIQIDGSCFAISDAEGELKFYTNGNVVASWDHSVMEGGKGFNEGSIFDDFLHDPPWYPGPDTMYNSLYASYTYQIIPDAYDEHIYYMIHSLVMPEDADCTYIAAPKMQISKIDMSAKNGKGRVVYKNYYFDMEKVSPYFTVVRHGNGKDWWVVLKKKDGLAYRSILLQRDTVIQVVNSTIPELSSDWFSCADWVTTNENLIQASMDGNRLLDIYGVGKVKRLSFDRCNGSVSLIDTFSTGVIPCEWGGDTLNCPLFYYQFSLSGRYLYGAGYAEFAQFDLEALDIAASKVKLGGTPWWLDEEQNVMVGSHGGFTAFAPGPDGKIYNLYRTSHSVIEYPDEPGEASGLCLAADSPPSCLGVPYYLFSGKYPNYRLGALSGSACDTILSGIEQPASPGNGYGVTVSPGIASVQAQVEVTLPIYGSNAIEIQAVDMLGRVVHRHRFPPFAYLHTLDVENWQPGIYNIVLSDQGKPRAAARVMVTK